MAEPVKGEQYDFSIGLDSVLGSGFQTNPTIAAGDFQISLDGGGFANLSNLPSVVPAGSDAVRIIVSAVEGNSDKVVIVGKDQAGDEWNDVFVFIDFPVANSQSAVDILEGDHVETKESMVINKKATTTALVNKKIIGSLLSSGVTIRTNEP